MREEILKITMTVDDEKIIGSTTDQVRGPRGYSAYEVAVLLGYVGNEESWLESLKVKGDQGRSAYRVAVDEGFVGTVNEWRDSLIGPRGPVYDDSDLREQIDLELASLTRIASEAADVATTKAGEAVDAKNIVVLRADEVDGHAVILYGLFNEIEDYRQEVYRRALESIEQAGIATTKAGEAVVSAGDAEQSAQASAQSASEAEQTLIDKVSKTDIIQTEGQSSTSIMSQKAVTDLFNNLVPWLGTVIPNGDAVFDFEKNRYAVKGVPVGLSDISEFIRLSSATMWQDVQFVEVQNNTPRISSEGLLIEPQRTNPIVKPMNTWDLMGMTVTDTTLVGETAVALTNHTAAGARYVRTKTDLFGLDNKTAVMSFISKPNYPNTFIMIRTRGSSGYQNYDYDNSVFGNDDFFSASTSNEYFTKIESEVQLGVSNMYLSLYTSSEATLLENVLEVDVAGATVASVQVEEGIRATSFIPTKGAPATRSPDILNIPLLPTQTVTGDWDEGVTYSVADGVATFTGHGYIRNIIVEAL